MTAGSSRSITVSVVKLSSVPSCSNVSSVLRILRPFISMMVREPLVLEFAE